MKAKTYFAGFGAKIDVECVFRRKTADMNEGDKK